MILQNLYKETLDRLKSEKVISSKELYHIAAAFQIASGQGYAISKTKAILDYIIEGNQLIIDEDTYINSVPDLKIFFLKMGIDISDNKELSSYFE